MPTRAANVFARPFFCCLGLLCSATSPVWVPAAHAQSSPTSVLVSGVVVDSMGGVIAGTTVVLRVGATERRTISNAAGRFEIAGVFGGPARLTVSLDGFSPTEVAVSGSAAGLRVVLEPLPVSESLTVRAARPTLGRITSATRTDTPLRDVPQSVTVVSRELIADQTMRSMADVVRYIPGVGMAQGEGHRDAPIFRGNTSTADFLVDGVRDDTQYFRDLYNVDRVEALKGPNGMIFGRGGVGGVINRVTRQAQWARSGEVGLHTGAWGHRRITADVGNALGNVAGGAVAGRVTTMYETSGSYRSDVSLTRYGVNPTVAFALGAKTTLRAGYEFFHDERTTDRGIPSFLGRPLATGAETFFGNADLSNTDVSVSALFSLLEHRLNDRVTVRNRISYADYDKFYQNVFPGAVNATGSTVSVSGYNNGTARQNLFNQTDLIMSQRTGRFEHTALLGVEVGRQVTDNVRATAYFSSISPTTTSVTVPVSSPTTSLPIDFRPSATDANNHSVATVAAVYAQDQIALSRHVQALVGVRYERFAVDLLNNRTATALASEDGLLSPRLGLVVKPVEPVSLYASYALSYLPRAGEQLSSLSLTNQALDPEKFQNYEVGAKWDVTPVVAFTAALYRLDRGNVVVPDPVNPAVSILVDGQRSRR
jgi:catecholate siderophore receptor